jgi:hypothetical protein
MTVQAIQYFLNARPFRRFFLVTASGEKYNVPHPEFVTFSPSRRTCDVYGPDGESRNTLDVLTITDIQHNGGTKKRKRKTS